MTANLQRLHFRRMARTRITQFDGHLAEIMWRSQAKGNVYVEFFDLLRSVFTLEKPPEYMYQFPVFDTWSGGSLEDSIQPGDSGAESVSESETSGNEDCGQDLDPNNTLTSLASSTDLDRTLTDQPQGASGQSLPRASSSGKSAGPSVRQQEHVCHPPGFIEVRKDGPRTKTTERKQLRRCNPYAKSAFLSERSDDDDFQL